MQELEGGRGPHDDSIRFRTNRGEETYSQGNTRYRGLYNGYNIDYDRTQSNTERGEDGRCRGFRAGRERYRVSRGALHVEI